MNLKLNMDKIQKEYEEKKKKEEQRNSYNSDPDIWTLKTDKNMQGAALIRFLPAKDLDRFPISHWKEHFFKLPNGKIFREICPQSIGKPCPICEMNRDMWKVNKEKAQQVMAKNKYCSNILVIKEPPPTGDPKREGKVFKFIFGKQIWELLDGKLNPDEKAKALGKKPLHFFHPETGADFTLVSTKKGDFPNYSSESEFGKESAITKDVHGHTWEELYSQLFSQDEMFDQSQVKEWTEIQEKYNNLKKWKPDDGGEEAQMKKKTKSVKEEVTDFEDVDDDDDVPFDGGEDVMDGDAETDEDFFNRISKNSDDE